MKKLIVLLLIPLSIIFSCNSASSNKQAEKNSYEVAKESLEKQEPKLFLLVNSVNKHNLIGQTVIKGSITSKASVAIYKDAELKLSFYSKTQTLLETDRETIFETWKPGVTKNFKTKYFAPKGTDSVGMEVLSAKIVSE